MLPQNPICRLREIFRDEVRLHWPLRSVPRDFAFAVAGANEDAAGTSVSREFHVSVTVANDEGAMQIECLFRRCAVQHACFWLAAGTFFCGDVRAIINRINFCAGFGELFGHQFVYSMHKRFRKITAAHAGLIGDYDDGQTSIVEPADGSRNKVKHTKTAGVIQVANFFSNGAITIKENGRAQAGWISHATPGPKRAMDVPQLQPCQQ